MPGHSTHMHTTHAHCTRMHNVRGAKRSKRHFKDTVRSPASKTPACELCRWRPEELASSMANQGPQVSFYISVSPVSPFV